MHDGPNARSKVLGKFCRTPINMKVQASSNVMFVTLKTDSSHESKFKMVYTTQSNLKENGKVLIENFYSKKKIGI